MPVSPKPTRSARGCSWAKSSACRMAVSRLTWVAQTMTTAQTTRTTQIAADSRSQIFQRLLCAWSPAPGNRRRMLGQAVRSMWLLPASPLSRKAIPRTA